MSPKATRELIARFAAEPANHPVVEPEELKLLTPREREVVKLVGAGLSNDALAERLYVSRLTAKTHVNRAMMKLAGETGPSWS